MSSYNESVNDTLSFSESTSPVYVRVRKPGITDFLTITQTARGVVIPSPLNKTVVDNVTVTDSVSPQPNKGLDDMTKVADVITFSFTRGKYLTDTLVFSESLVGLLIPQGNYSYNIIDPVVAAYAASLTSTGSLTMMFSDTTVTLRYPDFGDVNSFEAFRIQRQNRGGDLQIFQDPIWPTTEILDFKFSQLDDVTDLMTFLAASQGGQITLKDQYGRTWLGYILTPEGQIVQPKRTTFTAAFKFQGVLQDS